MNRTSARGCLPSAGKSHGTAGARQGAAKSQICACPSCCASCLEHPAGDSPHVGAAAEGQTQPLVLLLAPSCFSSSPSVKSWAALNHSVLPAVVVGLVFYFSAGMMLRTSAPHMQLSGEAQCVWGRGSSSPALLLHRGPLMGQRNVLCPDITLYGRPRHALWKKTAPSAMYPAGSTALTASASK